MEKKILIGLGFQEDQTSSLGKGVKTYLLKAGHGGELYVEINPAGFVNGVSKYILPLEFVNSIKPKFKKNHTVQDFMWAVEYFVCGGEIERGVKMFEVINVNEMNKVLRNRD